MKRLHFQQRMIFVPCFFLLVLLVNVSFAQVATINITNVQTTVMNKTSLLFGITFDSRTSLTGNAGLGQFGYYNPNGTIIPAVGALFNNFPMSTLRYPGNGIGVGFDWKKSIGAIASRPNQDLLGTLGSPQPVYFGFDEFMAMVEARGVPTSEVQIMVPIYDTGTSGLTTTQQRAAIPNVVSNNADWVEYCNALNNGSNPGGGIDWAARRAANGHPQPYNVKIWNIGNEPWVSFEFGPSAANCASYLASVTPIINAMLAIDSTINITLPTVGNPTNPANWSFALLQSPLIAQGKVYALSQHYFPTERTTGGSPPNQGVAAVNTGLNSLITVASAKGVKVFVGDYAHNIADNPTTAQKDSAMQWLGAILEADFLLMLSQKSTIERANFWTYGNAQAAWHPIRYNSPGNYTLMPAAAIYKILFPAFLDKSVAVQTSSPAASDGNPYSVRANAFLSNDGTKLNIVAVNRDKLNTVPLQPTGTSGYNLLRARLLTAAAPNAESIIEQPLTAPYSMPPMSVVILEFGTMPTSVGAVMSNSQVVTLFPNPTSGVLTFSEPLRIIEVCDVHGHKIMSGLGVVQSLSVEKLPVGTYFITSDKGTIKFIVQR